MAFRAATKEEQDAYCRVVDLTEKKAAELAELENKILAAQAAAAGLPEPKVAKTARESALEDRVFQLEMRETAVIDNEQNLRNKQAFISEETTRVAMLKGEAEQRKRQYEEKLMRLTQFLVDVSRP